MMILMFSTRQFFPLHEPYPGDSGAKLVKVADFNRDGLDDILELNSTDLIRVFLNSGNMQFDGPIIVTNSSVSISQVLVDDLSGDGYPDVVALDPDSGKFLLGHGIIRMLRALVFFRC